MADKPLIARPITTLQLAELEPSGHGRPVGPGVANRLLADILDTIGTDNPRTADALEEAARRLRILDLIGGTTHG